MPYDYEDSDMMELYQYYASREAYWKELAIDMLLVGNLRLYGIFNGIANMWYELKVENIPF